MMAQVFQSTFRVGSFGPIHFNASNTQGDSRHETIKFDAPMPGPAPGKRKGAGRLGAPTVHRGNSVGGVGPASFWGVR